MNINKKKICFVTTVSATLKAFVLKTAEYLHENTDWDISFICNDDDGFADSLPKYIHFHPVRMQRGISLSGITATLEMGKIFEREKFDLIQYSTPNASLYAAMASYLTRCPVRLYCQWGIVYVGFSGVKRKVFKAIEKMICSLSTWIEPDSYSNLAFAHKEGLYPGNKGSVIWNGSACGVDLEKFDIGKKSAWRTVIREKYHIPENAFVYGFIGRITRDKGINELMAAYRELSKESDVHLLIAGPSEIEDSRVDSDLYDWAQNCRNVIFTGYTSNVEKILSAMDVYVLPSYREGFGMGVVEAEAMGVPVIVTDIPGPTDAIINEKTGVIVHKADVDSLLEKMKMMHENRDILQIYGRNGVEFVKNSFEQKKFLSRLLKDRMRLIDGE